jgi:hypothetical protein
MADIGANYLGGDPAAPAGHGAGGKLTASAGNLLFRGQVMDAALKSSTVEVTLAKEEIRAASLGNANSMRQLTRAFVGEAIGGTIGAVVGAATGKRDHVLLVACTRDGFDFFCSFAVSGSDGAWLLNAIQAGRKDRGEAPLPRIEDLAGQEARDASDRQAAVLLEIRDLLQEQVVLLRQLVEGRAAP